jgi:hypothetical protein
MADRKGESMKQYTLEQAEVQQTKIWQLHDAKRAAKGLEKAMLTNELIAAYDLKEEIDNSLIEQGILKVGFCLHA